MRSSVCFQDECRYEKHLLRYLHDDENLSKKRQKNKKNSKTRPKSSISKPRPSRSRTIDLEDIEEDATEKRLSSPNNVEVAPLGHNRTRPAEPAPLSDSPSNDDAADNGVVVDKDPSQSGDRVAGPVDLDERDEDSELRAMFYLPKWSPVFPPSGAKPLPGGEEGLKVLLGDVAELLCRSPPPLDLDLDLEAAVAASSPPAHWRPQQPFQVSFTLDVDDEDEDFLMIMSGNNSPKADEKTSGDEQLTVRPHLEDQEQDISKRPPDSPTWDEVFEGGDKDDDRAARECGQEPIEIRSDDSEEDVACRDVSRKEEAPDVTEGKLVDAVIENSMDLFEDDEAFLQMTIPDIVTPRMSPAVGEANATKHASTVSKGRSLLLSSPTCGPLRSRPNLPEHSTPTTADTLCRERAAAEEPVDSATQPKSFLEERRWQPLDGSRDFFSVNFDLGYSLEESEEEQGNDAALSRPGEKTPVVGSSTPGSSFLASKKPHEARLSTPQAQVQSRAENSRHVLSPLTSPVWLPGAQRVAATPTLHSGLKRRRLEAQGALPEFGRSGCGIGGSHPHPGCFCFFCKYQPTHTLTANPLTFLCSLLPHSLVSFTVMCSSDSEDEVLVHKRRQNKVDPLSSPHPQAVREVVAKAMFRLQENLIPIRLAFHGSLLVHR